MGFDFYRRDNLTDPRSFEEAVYCRSTIASFGLVWEVLEAAGVLDLHLPAPVVPCTEQERALRSPDAATVPAFKFATHDQWIVDPEECTLIADALERITRDTRAFVALSPQEAAALEFLERFARFNRTAVPHGGYVVE